MKALGAIAICAIASWVGVGASMDFRRDAPNVAAPVGSNRPEPAENAYIDRRGWEMGTDGPVLSEAFAKHVLKLDPAARERVDGILQSIHKEGLALEPAHSVRPTEDSGHVTTIIPADPKAVAALENRLWSQLDPLLNPEQQKAARYNLRLHPAPVQSGMSLREIVAPNFFGWTDQGAIVEVWRVGTWFHWRVSTRGYIHTDSAPQLPPELQRFWEPPKPTVSSQTEALLLAAERGQVSQVRKLLTEGADVNDKNADGETALIKAAAGGHTSLTITLILLGAAPAEQDSRGRTALMVATENGHASLIHSWLKLDGFLSRVRSPDATVVSAEDFRQIPGVDVRALENVEVRPIEFSVFELEKIQDKEGETALMKAAARGHSDCARELLGHPAPVALRDKKGQTALMHAVINRRAGFLRDMLEFKNAVMGAISYNTFLDPEEAPWTDGEARTAIQRAAELEEPDIAELLRHHLDNLVERDTQLISKGGDLVRIYYRHRGHVYEALGNHDKAAADFREAKRLGDPN